MHPAFAVRITGMPRFAAGSTGNSVEPETARGGLEPGTYTGSDQYAVNLSVGWPETWEDGLEYPALR